MRTFGTVSFLKEGEIRSQLPLVKPSCTFGRSPACDIRLHMLKAVSKQHCELTVSTEAGELRVSAATAQVTCVFFCLPC